ncbi:1,2-dihydroxy-3-keto-5-methylthiopentene dioxygenase [Coemansia spiralis]|nr:1,2-dihydroxy-3-keto-5-methylthiopentene dioxygenase [Coemansia spiralis]
MRAYYHDHIEPDQHEAHDTGVDISAEQLLELGVVCKRIEGTTAERMAAVDELYKERKCQGRDQVTVSPAQEDYATQVKAFTREHLHEDEEIRFLVGGAGFFDIRDKEDRWVRMAVEEGDLLIVPAGIYHRFSLTPLWHMEIVRLFSDMPKWEAQYRPEADSSECRLAYLRSIGSAV